MLVSLDYRLYFIGFFQSRTKHAPVAPTQNADPFLQIAGGVRCNFQLR